MPPRVAQTNHLDQNCLLRSLAGLDQVAVTENWLDKKEGEILQGQGLVQAAATKRWPYFLFLNGTEAPIGDPKYKTYYLSYISLVVG